MKARRAILIASMFLTEGASHAQPQTTNDNVQVEDRIVLVCPVSDPKAQIDIDFVVTIDLAGSTANGWPADISQSEVRWKNEGGKIQNYYVLNRYTASLRVGPKGYPSMFTSQCKRQSDKLF